MTSHDTAVEIVALNLFEIADRCCEVITRTMVQWRTTGPVDALAPHCP